MDTTQALSDLVSQTGASPVDRRMLFTLAERLETSSCEGLARKLKEYAHGGAKVANLVAELRMALALSSVTGARIEFQTRDAADLRVRAAGIDCTVEVEHKSSASAYAAVFHPDPDGLASYAHGKEAWQTASYRLHEILRDLPVNIEPWLHGNLDEPHWSWQERAEQEKLCGALAEWLAERLPGVPLDQRTQLVHGLARFDVTPLERPPGRISGAGPLSVFRLREYASKGDDRLSLSEWLGRAIRRKSEIIAKDPGRRGPLHLIGLVVDEAFACSGGVLANTFLGGLVADCGSSRGCRYYRRVPVTGRGLIRAAYDHGHAELLTLMGFDPERPTEEEREGLVFDKSVHENVDGVIALYYTDMLQFLPSPFTQRVDSLCRLFPRILEPFELPSSEVARR